MKPFDFINVIKVYILVLLAVDSQSLIAADAYQEHVAPFAKKYCIKCHNDKEARGELNLNSYKSTKDVTGHFRRWNNIIEFIRSGEMPPKDALQPSLEERKKVVTTVEKLLFEEARKNAGDPGIILPRRLSNTEYDLSIRDLTGIDIRPTKEFPADPAAGEGFDNTGEALSMSPSLLKKYLAASQLVANHLVLKSNGISFAPFPVTSYNERKKLTEQAVIDFYKNHEVHIVDYLEAAWRYRHRKDSERKTSPEGWAMRQNLSPKYFSMVWGTLSKASSTSGYLKLLGDMWEKLPEPPNSQTVPQELAELNRFLEFCRKRLCHREDRLIRSNAGNWPIGHLDFRAKTAVLRDKFDPANFKSKHLIKFDRIRRAKGKENELKSVNIFIQVNPAFNNSQNSYLVLKNTIFSNSNNLPRNESEQKKHEVITLKSLLEKQTPESTKQFRFGIHPEGHEIDEYSFVVKSPASIKITLTPEILEQVDGKFLLAECELDSNSSQEGAVYIQHSIGKAPQDSYSNNVELLLHPNSEFSKGLFDSSQKFCETFPNRFFYVDNKRGLAAGFHLVEGFFRDDRPLVEKVLDKKQSKELDQLWEELHFVTQSAENLIRGFVWFERSERHVLQDERFDFLRAQDPKLIQNKMLSRFEKVYMDRMGIKLLEDSLKPETPSEKYEIIHRFFEQVRSGLARRRELLKSAEQHAQEDLLKFAQRAYRRPLRDDETESINSFYDRLRKQGQGVEDSVRGVLTAILMSPDFCYHFTEAPEGSDVSPLSDTALASRLSYFLWSSLPDEQLLDATNQSKLQDEKELFKQTRRMLKDPKIESFAREFFGQWLRYRDYLSKDPINAETFPGYTEELRQAMFEEPVRLATYLIQEDQPITDLLNSDMTIVNGVLAKHYGSSIATQYNSQKSKWLEDLKKRGLAVPTNPNDQWHRVERLRETGRGGLFGMGVILTKNSAGERTSPVKRGFWAVHHLLGQHFPPPPTDVPELPPNEKVATKTIRELIAEHTVNAKCAMCHVHFDSLGMALEGFDPIGRSRTKDLAGRPIDDLAKFPNGKSAKGVNGLIEYVEQNRRQDFVRTLCRKFLGYALGRSVVLSDQPLLQEMEKSLETNGYRFSILFETVIKSPQFRKQRGREFATTGR